MNIFIFMGRLTKDPEIRYTQSGKAIASFSLAVDRLGKDKEADFFQCQAWEGRAEFCERYLQKGSKILAKGHVATGSYTDKDGKKIYTTTFVCDQIEFADSKKSEERREEPRRDPKPDENGFIDGSDLPELPFN